MSKILQTVLAALTTLLIVQQPGLGTPFIKVDPLSVWGDSPPENCLYMSEEKVSIDIQDRMAHVVVMQNFRNTSDVDIGGVYDFPLPTNAVVSAFRLNIDGRMTDATVREKGAAREQYDNIVRRRVDPGIVELTSDNWVHTRIFPIPAHGSKNLELEYSLALLPTEGYSKLTIPIFPSGQARRLETLNLSASVHSSRSLNRVWSPTHKRDGTLKDIHTSHMELTERDITKEEVFELCLMESNGQGTPYATKHDNRDGQSFFAVSWSPKEVPVLPPGEDIVIAIDTSGSMLGKKLDLAKRIATSIINTLADRDRFVVLRFDSEVNPLGTSLGLTPATRVQKNLMLEQVQQLDCGGGTDLQGVLTSADKILSKGAAHNHSLVVITDAVPTSGPKTAEQIASACTLNKYSHIFRITLGTDANKSLAAELASQNVGSSSHVASVGEIQSVISSVTAMAKEPIFSDIWIDCNGVPVTNMQVLTPQALQHNQEWCGIGMLPQNGSLNLRYTDASGVARQVPVVPSSGQNDNPSVEHVWAKTEIDELSASQNNPESEWYWKLSGAPMRWLSYDDSWQYDPWSAQWRRGEQFSYQGWQNDPWEIAPWRQNDRYFFGRNAKIDKIISLSEHYGVLSRYCALLAVDERETSRIMDAKGRFRNPSASWSSRTSNLDFNNASNSLTFNAGSGGNISLSSASSSLVSANTVVANGNFYRGYYAPLWRRDNWIPVVDEGAQRDIADIIASELATEQNIAQIPCEVSLRDLDKRIRLTDSTNDGGTSQRFAWTSEKLAAERQMYLGQLEPEPPATDAEELWHILLGNQHVVSPLKYDVAAFAMFHGVDPHIRRHTSVDSSLTEMNINGRMFFLESGRWMDDHYRSAKYPDLIKVTEGSDMFNQLVDLSPGIGSLLASRNPVIIVFGKSAYEIQSSNAAEYYLDNVPTLETSYVPWTP